MHRGEFPVLFEGESDVFVSLDGVFLIDAGTGFVKNFLPFLGVLRFFEFSDFDEVPDIRLGRYGRTVLE